MSDNQPSGAAVGFTAFAGVMMIVVGFFHAIAGFGALLDDTVYVKTPNYVFSFDVTTWGWIHLIVGVILAIAGFGVFTGSVVARTVGVLLAGISAIANFAFLLGWNAPFWSIIIIAIDVTIIWALTMHGRDITEV